MGPWEGGGARSGTSPAWGFPSKISDLPSISFLRGNDIAQSGLARPHDRSLLLPSETSPCLDWAPPSGCRGGPITVRSHRCYTCMAP